MSKHIFSRTPSMNDEQPWERGALAVTAGDLALQPAAPVRAPARPASVAPAGANLFWHPSRIKPAERQALFTQRPATAWLTGLSGAGKSTIAFELERLMVEHGRRCFVLDGDNIRHRLNRDLGFSPAERKENIRRVAEVAHLMNEAGLIVITAFISPYREDRAMARDVIGADRFVEVHVSADASLCAARDPKGLYAKARAGSVASFTGVSAPYEPPESPDLTLDTGDLSLEEATHRLFTHLAVRFFH
ncbi:MAG TPA: adenylyl-sulfate kinase [Burkholderiaceae bacterium]|nr:adenylyl-sulfate kinase [Burkholderiaceae bacterium]